MVDKTQMHPQSSELIDESLHHSLFSKSVEGRVYACFNRSINILFPEDGMVTLHSSSEDIGPLGIVLREGLGNFSRVEAGDSAYISGGFLYVSGIRCDVRGAETWSSHPVWPKVFAPLAHLKRRARKLAEIMRKEAPDDGLYPALWCMNHDSVGSGPCVDDGGQGSGPCVDDGGQGSGPCVEGELGSRSVWLTPEVMADLETLANALRSAQVDAIRSIKERLIGYGPGLTPAFDDMLVGMLGALHYLKGHPAYREGQGLAREGHTKNFDAGIVRCIDAIGEEGKTETTILSRQMIRLAREGKLMRRLHACMHHFFSDDSREEDEWLGMAPMREIGSSSGLHMLAGLIIIADNLITAAETYEPS